MKREYRLSEEITKFEEQLEAEEKSKNTIVKYIRDVRAFHAWLGKRPVTHETVIAYKAKLISGGYAVGSVNSMLASLNRFFDFLNRKELKVKALKLQRQIYCSEEKELKREEFERLVNTARKKGDDRLEMILQTIVGTGIRVSELKFITAEAVKTGEATVSMKGKIRNIILVGKLKKLLLTYLKKHKISTGPIFVTRTGKPMDRTNIWREMKKLCEEAGVKPGKVFPHNIRHLFARIFYKAKKDIVKLADILGHSSIATTRIYIMSTGAEHRKYMESLKLIV